MAWETIETHLLSYQPTRPYRGRPRKCISRPGISSPEFHLVPLKYIFVVWRWNLMSNNICIWQKPVLEQIKMDFFLVFELLSVVILKLNKYFYEIVGAWQDSSMKFLIRLRNSMEFSFSMWTHWFCNESLNSLGNWRWDFLEFSKN